MSLSPIFRLPPETLENIFIHAAQDYFECDSEHDLIYRIPHWVNVSYICHHWRDVALNCPTLWTYHFTLSLRWTEELLARSKQASLKIRIYFDHERAISWWSELLEKLLNCIERIQELRLHVPATVVPSELSLRAPRLEILDICGIWNRPSEWISTINDGDIPPLRILKIADYPLPWHSFNLKGVTTLFLSCVPPPSRQGIVEFLATLSRMQALTFLHLERALASARGFISSEASESSPKFDLPSLVRLCFRESLSTVVALLSCINIPTKAQVRLELQWEDGSTTNDYARIPSAVARRFCHSQDLSSFSPTIHSLAIRFPLSRSTFTLWAFERGNRDSCLPMEYYSRWDCNVPFMISVEMEWPVTVSNGDRIISDICSSIPLTHVQTLCVIEPPLSAPDFWRNTFGHLHRLRKLTLSDGYMPDLASVLTLPAVETLGRASDRDLRPGPKFVPALEELELRCITFASENDSLPLWRGISRKSLLGALATRKALYPRHDVIVRGVEDGELDMQDDVQI